MALEGPWWYPLPYTQGTWEEKGEPGSLSSPEESGAQEISRNGHFPPETSSESWRLPFPLSLALPLPSELPGEQPTGRPGHALSLQCIWAHRSQPLTLSDRFPQQNCQPGAPGASAKGSLGSWGPQETQDSCMSPWPAHRTLHARGTCQAPPLALKKIGACVRSWRPALRRGSCCLGSWFCSSW